MPERTLAEAVADLRLSDRKLASDFAAIRTRLLTSVAQLESDAKLNVHFKINENDIIDEFAQLESFATQFAPTTKLHLNSDAAISELASLNDIVDPIVVPVNIDAQDANAQLGALSANVGSTLESAGGEGGKRFGTALIGGFRGIIGTVGIAAGGFIASALVSGFERLTTIEDATASLTVALGDAHQAATLLDQVLGVVRGTPFNLDQFALAASNMVSFGIEAKKVPGYLTAIGEAAASRGSRANEFAQRLSTIFGQITTANRIDGQELLQFSETGVNALVILANHFGVTTAKMREMVSQGIVPAKESLDVLAAGILNGSTGVAGATVAFAGTMAKLRETLTGSIGGFKAATARFGVELIKPFEGILIAGFQGATSAIDSFAGKVKTAFQGISTSDFAKNLAKDLKDLPDIVDRVAAAFAKLGPALAPLAGILGASGLGNLRTILGPLGSFIPEVLTNPMVAALAAFALFTPEIRDSLIPAVQELAKAFEPLLATLGVSLGKVVEAAVPAIESLIQAFTKLMPLFESLLNTGIAVAAALVPAFSAFATVLNAIPIPVLEAMVVAFLAFKALSFVETSKSFKAFAGGMTESFTDGTRTIEEAATKTQRVMSGMEAAVTGAFSGMALASSDGAAKISGAIGAISSVALGFATGGPWGGAAAAVGVGIGLIVGHFTEAAKKSAELKQHTTDLAEAFGKNTLAVLKDKDALAAWADKAGDVSGVQDALGATLLADKTNGPLIQNGLNQLGLISAGPVGESNTEKVLAGIKANIDDLSGSPEILHALTDAFGSFGDNLAREIPKFSSVGKLQEMIQAIQNTIDQGLDTSNFDPDLVAFVKSLNGEGLSDGDTKLLKGIFDLQKAAKGTDLQALTAQQLDYAASQDASFAIALKYTEALDGLNHATADYNDQLKLTADTVAFVAKNQNFLIDEQIRGALKQKGLTDAAINAQFDLADELGVHVEDLGAGITDVLGTSMVDGFHKARDAAKTVVDAAGNIVPQLDDATIAANNLAAAVLLSAAAAARVSAEIDALKGKLSFRTGVQDFVSDIRKVGDGFSKIINESDLKKGESLNKSISDTADRIQKLQVDVNKEADQAAAKAVDLKDRIDRARAAGAVGGVALLENELAHVNDKAEAKRQELDKALSEAHGKAGELAALGGSAPITLLQQLTTQAKERNLSLFNLLLQAPTPEALSAFQGLVKPVIDDATNQFVAEATKHPENAKNIGIFYRQVIVNSLVEGGLDPDTAKKIADEFFNPTRAAEAITDNAKLAHQKYVDEMRKAFLQDPDLLKKLLAQLNAPGLSQEAKDSIKQSIKDVFNQNQIELGITPTLVTDADISTLLGLSKETIKLAPEISVKASLVNLEATTLVVTVAAPSKDDLVTTGDLTQQQVDQMAEITKQLNVLPPDSPAAAKLTAEAQDIIDHAGDVTVNVTPTFQSSQLDSELKKWILTNPLTTPVPVPVVPLGRSSVIRSRDGNVLTEDHTAGIFRSMRLFAEPETHGEAYIPLSPFKRERSLQLMSQVAEIFGVDLIPKMKMPLPSAMTGGGSRVSTGDADLIGRAVARHTKPTAADRAASFAEQFEQGVHFEQGAIVIEGASTPRRTASQLVSRLRDLAVSRR